MLWHQLIRSLTKEVIDFMQGIEIKASFPFQLVTLSSAAMHSKKFSFPARTAPSRQERWICDSISKTS
jgi:hypothetical protein